MTAAVRWLPSSPGTNSSPPSSPSCFARLSGFLEQAQFVLQIDDLPDHGNHNGDQFVPGELGSQRTAAVIGGLENVEHEIELLPALTGQRDRVLDGANGAQNEREQLEDGE